MRSPVVAFAAAALALVAPALAAAEPRHPVYLVAKAGGYFPTHSDVTKHETTLAGELALGYAPDPGFALELATGKFNVVREEGDTTLRDMRVIPVTLAIRGTVPVKRLEPYAILGGGLYLVHDEVGGEDDDAVNLGLFLGGGMNMNLSSRLFVGVEARYLVLGANTFDSHTRVDGISLTADLGLRF